MKMEFIKDGPALVIENTERLLIVADLHFGIEADLAAHGMHFKSHSTERLARLMQTIDATQPDRLILLGDVKHSIPSLTRQEWREIPGILDTIRRRIPILLFPGNHDIGIERFLEPGNSSQRRVKSSMASRTSTATRTRPLTSAAISLSPATTTLRSA